MTNDWQIVRFGDVVRDVNESERNPIESGLKRYVGLEHFDPGVLSLKRWGDLTTDKVSFTKRFRKGQVLFGKRRAYQRKIAVAEFDGICSSDILTFEPKDSSLLPELLPFIVQSNAFFDHALGTSSGSLSPRTRWSQLKDFTFGLPSRKDQRSIVATLQCASDVVQNYQKAVCEFDSTLRSVFNHIFTHGVQSSPTITTGRVSHPESWSLRPLGEIAEFVTSGSRGWAKFYAKQGPLFLRSQNVRDQELDFSDRQHVCPPVGTEGERTRVRPGDILITVTGNSVGNVAFVPETLAEAYVSQHVGLIRLVSPDLHRLVSAFLSPSGPGNQQIIDAQYGQSKPGLSLMGIREFLIPIPPTEEARQIDSIIRRFHVGRRLINDHLESSSRILATVTNSLLSKEGLNDDVQ